MSPTVNLVFWPACARSTINSAVRHKFAPLYGGKIVHSLTAQHLDAAIDNMERYGVPVEVVRIDEFTGRRLTFFQDPDGLPLDFYEVP